MVTKKELIEMLRKEREDLIECRKDYTESIVSKNKIITKNNQLENKIKNIEEVMNHLLIMVNTYREQMELEKMILHDYCNFSYQLEIITESKLKAKEMR